MSSNSKGNRVTVNDLPQYLLQPGDPVPIIPTLPPAMSSIPAGQTHIMQKTARAGSWVQLEKEMIMAALGESRGNRTKAAEILGWGRTTLWRKLKKHQIA